MTGARWIDATTGEAIDGPVRMATEAERAAVQARAERRRVARRRQARRRGIVRAIAWMAAGIIAWQVAGWIADGAVAGVATAHGAEITPSAVDDPVDAFAPTYVRRCVTLDTGRNVATMGRMRYPYRDRDGITWTRPTPAHVRAMVAGMIALHARTGHRGPWQATACITLDITT